MSLNKCLTTKFLASVLTVKDVMTTISEIVLTVILSGSSCLSTWCPLLRRLLERLSSLLPASSVVVGSSALSEVHSSTRCSSAAVVYPHQAQAGDAYRSLATMTAL